MPARCAHLKFVKTDTPNTDGCEECLAAGDTWVHLRLCRQCGHVGCCDNSKNKHATKHFKKTASDHHLARAWGGLELVLRRRDRHGAWMSVETEGVEVAPPNPIEARWDQAFPRVTPAQIGRLEAHGKRMRQHQARGSGGGRRIGVRPAGSSRPARMTDSFPQRRSTCSD